MNELIEKIIDLVNEQRDSNGQISKEKLHVQLELILEKTRIKNNCIISNVNCITLEEGKQLVDYGFNYHITSQHNGYVPVGNYLQKLVSIKGLIEAPEEWDEYRLKNKK